MKTATCEKIIEDWLHGVASYNPSCSLNASKTRLYSYGMVIGQIVKVEGKTIFVVILRSLAPSRTTKRHITLMMNAIMRNIPKTNPSTIYYTDYRHLYEYSYYNNVLKLQLIGFALISIQQIVEFYTDPAIKGDRQTSLSQDYLYYRQMCEWLHITNMSIDDILRLSDAELRYTIGSTFSVLPPQFIRELIIAHRDNKTHTEIDGLFTKYNITQSTYLI